MPEKHVIACRCRPIPLNDSAIGLIHCPTRTKPAGSRHRSAKKLTSAIGSIFHFGSLPYLDKVRVNRKQSKTGWSLLAKRAWDSTWQESWLLLEKTLLPCRRV